LVVHGVFFMIYTDKQVKFVASHCSLSGAEVTGYYVGKLKLHEDVIGLKGLHSFAFALRLRIIVRFLCNYLFHKLACNNKFAVLGTDETLFFTLPKFLPFAYFECRPCRRNAKNGYAFSCFIHVFVPI
jgi:hypothetical protein